MGFSFNFQISKSNSFSTTFTAVSRRSGKSVTVRVKMFDLFWYLLSQAGCPAQWAVNLVVVIFLFFFLTEKAEHDLAKLRAEYERMVKEKDLTIEMLTIKVNTMCVQFETLFHVSTCICSTSSCCLCCQAGCVTSTVFVFSGGSKGGRGVSRSKNVG